MIIRCSVIVWLTFAMSACAISTQDVGRAPPMSAVGSGLNRHQIAMPVGRPGYANVGTTGSIWRDTSADLYSDPRARHIGDSVTVKISIEDEASLDSSSDRSRAATRDFSFGINYDVGLGGFKRSGSGNGTSTVDSESTHKGEGQTSRSEKITLVMAVVVTNVLPNGNMVVQGSQEVRVNYESRILTVAGIVRPRDIEQDNSISYDKIAEARISYGGRGRITEVQQPGYVQQLMDLFTPF